jgi:hypothetical protein
MVAAPPGDRPLRAPLCPGVLSQPTSRLAEGAQWCRSLPAGRRHHRCLAPARRRLRRSQTAALLLGRLQLRAQRSQFLLEPAHRGVCRGAAHGLEDPRSQREPAPVEDLQRCVALALPLGPDGGVPPAGCDERPRYVTSPVSRTPQLRATASRRAQPSATTGRPAVRKRYATWRGRAQPRRSSGGDSRCSIRSNPIGSGNRGRPIVVTARKSPRVHVSTACTATRDAMARPPARAALTLNVSDQWANTTSSG